MTEFENVNLGTPVCSHAFSSEFFFELYILKALIGLFQLQR